MALCPCPALRARLAGPRLKVGGVTMKISRSAQEAQTGAAAMAFATKGRKTRWKSPQVLRGACRDREDREAVREARYGRN